MEAELYSRQFFNQVQLLSAGCQTTGCYIGSSYIFRHENGISLLIEVSAKKGSMFLKCSGQLAIGSNQLPECMALLFVRV